MFMQVSMKISDEFKKKLASYITTAFVTLIGLAFFIKRELIFNTPILQITYDTTQYISLIDGHTAPEPFASRFLIVLLARILPFSSIDSLYIINVISMITLILGIYTILENYTKIYIVKFYTILSVSLSFAFAYNFTNPYLTDMPALAALMFALIHIKKRKFHSCIIIFYY